MQRVHASCDCANLLALPRHSTFPDEGQHVLYRKGSAVDTDL